MLLHCFEVHCPDNWHALGRYVNFSKLNLEYDVFCFFLCMYFQGCATDETKHWLSSRNSAEIRVLGLHLCTWIWVHVMIGLLKKPLSIYQSGWKEIQNALPVFRWGPRTRISERCFADFTMDTSKSVWIPCAYYTTLYSTPRYTILIRRIYWAGELLEKWGNQSQRQLCKKKCWIQGLAPKYSD